MLSIFGKKTVDLEKIQSPKVETLAEVEARFTRSGILSRPDELRKKIAIVAIDDKGFPPEVNLRNNGFKIQVLPDITRLSEVEPFQIILCDVNGVGINLSPDQQGAFVIAEIKRIYPHKIVVSYSAAMRAAKLVVAAKKVADFDFRKDASIDDWRELLDDNIKDLCNPIKVWKKERIRLLNAGIDLNELIRIESAILNNLGTGSANVKSAIETTTHETGASGWTREIGHFLASKAFDAAFDYIFQ